MDENTVAKSIPQICFARNLSGNAEIKKQDSNGM